jgi:hypothetical protein
MKNEKYSKAIESMLNELIENVYQIGENSDYEYGVDISEYTNALIIDLENKRDELTK